MTPTKRTDEEGRRLGRLVSGPVPPGAEVVGMVTRDGFFHAGDAGALVRLANGTLVQVNAGVVRTLPPRMVEAEGRA